ncbi:MAG: hypothetical protein ABSG90_04700 [Dehalococcoidia bacterium]|jgi:F0F1-type ATP synthase membrane subunit b/b'
MTNWLSEHFVAGKALIIAMGFIGAVMLTFGSIFWYIGASLFILAVVTYFIVTIIVKRAQPIQDKVKQVEEVKTISAEKAGKASEYMEEISKAKAKILDLSEQVSKDAAEIGQIRMKTAEEFKKVCLYSSEIELKKSEIACSLEKMEGGSLFRWDKPLTSTQVTIAEFLRQRGIPDIQKHESIFQEALQGLKLHTSDIFREKAYVTVSSLEELRKLRTEALKIVAYADELLDQQTHEGIKEIGKE